MNYIDQIKKPIAKEIEAFEPKFRELMTSKVPLLDRITYYIIKRKGKQLRPILVFLIAKMLGKITETTYRGAALVELMHTATLIHDDVIDNSDKRRGFFSLNALWKNKIAVLVGDYLLSKVLLLAVDNKEYELLKIVSTAVKEMSEGELLQIEKARNLNIDESIYYEIIRKKTASLISSCCGVAAASVRQDEKITNEMRQFGELLGMAFQIKDDLFDYQVNTNVGKPTRIDIREQKMTLPLIYALNHASKKDKRFMINVAKRYNRNREKVEQVTAMVCQLGGVEHAEQKMTSYCQQAIDILEPYEQNTEKESLKNLAEYIISRNE